MADTFSIYTLIKKTDGIFPGKYCITPAEAPLLISVRDARAFVTNMSLQPIGYVSDPEHSKMICAKLQSKEVLMARMVGPCFCVSRSIHVWSEGHDKEEELRKDKKIDANA